MKLFRLLFLCAIFLTITVSGLKAQEKTVWPMQLYSMGNRLNPAVAFDRSMVVVTPSATLSLSNHTLTFNDVFNRGLGVNDTLLFFDFERMEERLRDHNPVNADASMSLLFAGLSLKNGKYATFSVSRRLSGTFSFPGTFADLQYGNADLDTNRPRTINLDNYRFDGALYTEYAFGLSKLFGSKFTAGFHLKFLHGQMGVKTSRFTADITTRDDFSESYLHSGVEIYLSSPFVEKENVRNDLAIDEEVLKEQLRWFYFTPKNFGFAGDLGFVYDLHEKFTLSGAVNDLGFIHWNESPQMLVSRGEYRFEGLRFTAADFDNFDLEEKVKQVTDTLQSIFNPVKSSEAFDTRLTARAYLGLVYRLNPGVTFSTLFTSVFSGGEMTPGVTAALLYTPWKRFSVTGNWSWSGYSFNNIGLGMVYTGKRWQVYAASDNLNAIDLLNTRAVNVAFGLNIVLWRGRGREEISTPAEVQ